ncbi:hypothetical protein GV794_07910 [Nocardia cyriacigeorgica]|uniref:Uncharacterized protein n=1 Tax=Nocardia cyriacigeorgica TaxID=135487 RepID=A0A6P1DE76_9NOCA|nr:hypothetical protein [Nocardia cyriacigeorgica]NEW40438.1 hypothetical protein [Nocardia cyriacigeorgica]NEW46722.1 hypothetical protein [Nocardia cyriacigeorgica]NEW55577.1 hypothetical protein [Nocardia cyriacigeorgica]
MNHSQFEILDLPGPPKPAPGEHLPTRSHAIGYLRADLTTNPGFEHARLRLMAIANGYHLTHILTVPGDDATADLLRLLRTLDPGTTDVVLTPHPGHVTHRQSIVLRTFCALRTGEGLHPRIDLDR